MILELRDICKTYTQGKLDVPVLKNVSLSVEEGEYLAIMGPSGSGKTTLMNLIGCLDIPTSGEYYLEGQELSGQSDLALSRVRLHSIGFVFQSFHLLPRQSALENVALPLLYAGVHKKERLETARKALERVGLADRVDFKPTQLSGGQCQRVAIARAIVNNPKILLADEPTGALDTASGEQIMEVFERLNSEGVTIVMITHEQQVALHAQRILYIRDGQLTDAQGNSPAIPRQTVRPAKQTAAVREETPVRPEPAPAPEEVLPDPARIAPPLPVKSRKTARKAEAVEDPVPTPAEEVSEARKIPEEEPPVSTDTFLDTEISALLDAGMETRDAGEGSPENSLADQLSESVPAEETPALVDRPTKSGAPAQITFDIWADPKEEFDTAAAEFDEDSEMNSSEASESAAEPAKKSATLIEIEDINVGFEPEEPEIVETVTSPAPVPEEKPIEEPKKTTRKKSAKLVEIEDINVGFEADEPKKPAEQSVEKSKKFKNSPSENSRKKSAKLVEIEDINVGFEPEEPEIAETVTSPALAPVPEEKPIEEPKKTTRKKSAKLVEIEDINVGFEADEPEKPAEQPVEEPKEIKNSPKENSRKKSAKLVEIEDINVGFDLGEPEAAETVTSSASAQEEKAGNSPQENSRKKASLIEIEDIKVEFDNED